MRQRARAAPAATIVAKATASAPRAAYGLLDGPGKLALGSVPAGPGRRPSSSAASAIAAARAHEPQLALVFDLAQRAHAVADVDEAAAEQAAQATVAGVGHDVALEPQAARALGAAVGRRPGRERVGEQGCPALAAHQGDVAADLGRDLAQNRESLQMKACSRLTSSDGVVAAKAREVAHVGAFADSRTASRPRSSSSTAQRGKPLVH